MQIFLNTLVYKNDKKGKNFNNLRHKVVVKIATNDYLKLRLPRIHLHQTIYTPIELHPSTL